MPIRRPRTTLAALALAAGAALPAARPIAAQPGLPSAPPDGSPHAAPHVLPRTAPHVEPHTAPHAAAHTTPHTEPHVAPHARPHGVHGAASVAASSSDAGPHLRLTPPRAAADGDSARTAAVERALLAQLARYADVRDAERDGYARFLPGVPQRVYHYTSRRHAVRAAFAFDPARPTSLLYRDAGGGRLVLVGAMYTAPARASLDRLDRRVPLSTARWHQHVAICLPRAGDRERWRETDGGRMRFGPAGTIATRPACDAAGGRFHERLFGWMVHADLVATPQGPRLDWTGAHGEH